MQISKWYDTVYESIREEVSEQLDGGTLSQIGQSLASQVMPSLINSLKDVVPNQRELQEIANKVSSQVVLTVKNKILPRLYNRTSTPLKLSGVTVSDESLRKYYDSLISKVPQNFTIDVQGRTITLNFRTIVQQSFTYPIFKNYMQNVFLPVSNQFIEDLAPAKARVQNAAGLALTTSFVLGAISMFGFIKLIEKARG